ncbi:MAG: hypothetical protein ACOYYS_17760 [Chloroflexota bacterium]
MTTSSPDLWVFVPVTAWLAACAWHDLRTRQVPNLLTVPPLLLVTFWLAVSGRPLLALQIVLLVLVSELPGPDGRRRALLGSVLTLLLALYQPSVEAIFQALALYASWAMWELRLAGAADAKLLMALVGLFSVSVFFAIILVGGLQGLLWKLAKRQGGMPYAVSIAAGTAIWLASRW